MADPSPVSKRTRRPNRTSTWWLGADGKWHGRVWMGVKPDGSPDRRHVERKDEPSVIKRIRELEAQRDAGLAPKAGRVPRMSEWCAYCLDTVMPLAKKAPKTIQGYRSDVRNWIVPELGQHRINMIRPDHLEALYTKMIEAGMADSHVRKVHAIISSFLTTAVKRGSVPRNVARLVDPPGVGESAKEHLTRKEARAVITQSQAEGRRNAARWSVGLALGVRQGETLGLRWPYLVAVCVECTAATPLTEWWAAGEPACEECGGPVGFEARIWWQLQRLTWQHGCVDVKACTEGKHRRACPARCPKAKRTSGRPHKCVPKDAAGLCPKDCRRHASTCPDRKGGGLVFREIKEKRRKTVSVAPELVALLRKHHVAQKAERLAAGSLWEDHDMVFAQWNGRPIDSRRDWQDWADLLKAAKIPHHKVHAARHTAATLMLEAGVALAVVQEMLGHSDIRVTRGYTHVASPLMADGAARMGRTLFGK